MAGGGIRRSPEAMVRVLVLQDSGINESLAMTEASAVLKRGGHSTRLLLTDETRRPGPAVRRLDPDLVVIPCPVAGDAAALAGAELVRRYAPGATIVLGGTHATFHPELAKLDTVDAVINGEAEGALLDIADRLSASRSYDDVENVTVFVDGELVSNPLRPLIQDLDALPMPDRELYFRYPFVARLPWKKFASGRGCIHHCSYCWNATLQEAWADLGRFVRRKSAWRAVEEILEVRQRWPMRRVHFSDDLFTVHPAWLEEFASLYSMEVGAPFTCNTSTPLVSARTVDALKRAGCKGVAIGVETGNEALRSSLLGKTVTDDEIATAADLIKSRGLELYTFNMVASPGETVDDVLATIELNRRIGADRVRVNIAVPLADTSFEETAFSLGFLESRPEVEDYRSPRTYFEGDQRRAMVNLYLLFRAGVHSQVPASTLRMLARLPTAALLPLKLQGTLEERAITGLPWLEGLRFFAHVGDPHRRTANYVTLI